MITAKLISTLILCYLVLTTAVPILAQGDKNGCSGGECYINIGYRQKAGEIPGIPAMYNPNASVGNIVSNAMMILFIAGGLAVLVFILWGAFDWVTSGGDKEKISSARRKIVNALIGLTLLALAGFITALAGQIVGYNPLSPTSPPLPRLDQAPTTATP